MCAKVLVIRGGAIGDFIHTLPLLEAIVSQCPSSEVAILGYRAIAELVVGRRLAASVRRVDGAEWAALFAPSGELDEAERAYLAGFDRVFCVWPDDDGVLRENLANAGVTDLVCVDPVPPEAGGIHVVRHVADQCSRAGLPLKSIEPHLYPSERDRWWAERYLRVTCAGERPLLGLHPGSGAARKNWPAKGYAEVAWDWIRRRQGHVLVAAGPADDSPVGALGPLLDDDAVFLMRNEPLPRVAAVLERCEAFVGNDSGITHMAAAVRTPTVAIFGPTDPQVWRPLAPRVCVVSAPDKAQGLAGLDAAEVIRAIEHVLGG